MSKSTDERGRLYLPKDVRERFGDEYRIVQLPNYVALFPVADDPLAAVREIVGDAIDAESVTEAREIARQRSRGEIAAEREREHEEQ
ncbi:hypothetical protein BRD20_04260 [Halobacteriales archaeon SW_8_65_20]|nr:MAG: hypothetical protein BRC71_01590 [Halobacteriales archaeon QH_7_65_31]PSQ30854.1 MAG: hypothetical protein BRD16_06420 [Halobacteriales archaeon SW_6_65_46]PSQ53134.1 MAG: hypothetical protein BRD20_04260 [Halobacteriales archaeon SW_8_65_20]